MEPDIEPESVPRTSTGSHLWTRRVGRGHSNGREGGSLDAPDGDGPPELLHLCLPFPSSRSHPCFRVGSRPGPQCSPSPPPSPVRTPPEQPKREHECSYEDDVGPERAPRSKLAYTRLVQHKSPKRRHVATSCSFSSLQPVAQLQAEPEHVGQTETEPEQPAGAPSTQTSCCSCRPDEPGVLSTYCKCGRTAAEHAPAADLDPLSSLPFPLSPEVRTYSYVRTHTHV